jgi:hypothetical protein
MSHVTNPFASNQLQQTEQRSLAQTDQQRAIAEVQAAMLIARANPRDQSAAMDRIINACSRPTMASSATYDYARGGTQITGPSIRLAEAIAQAWGNIQFGIRELDQSNGESTVQAYCWDIETNSRREVTFQVPHVRYSRSRGNTQLTDPRDIYEMVANVGARRLRSCILAVVPGDVTEAAVQQCEETLRANVDTSPDSIKRLLEAFSALGVTKAQIEKRIQRRLESILPAQIIGLRKVYNSIREGMSSPGDWFEQAASGQAEDIMSAARKQAEGSHEEGIAEWPKQVSGSWVDSRGIRFNPEIHGMRGQIPAVTESGEFRKRRGCDPAIHERLEREALAAINEPQGDAEAEPEPELQEPELPDYSDALMEGVGYHEVRSSIERATNTEDLADAEDMIRDGFEGTPDQREELNKVIAERRHKLAQIES